MTTSSGLKRGKVPISCFVRALNEEATIGRVIAAASALAEEVIIVDSGSTDRTSEIAERAGAKVIRQPWLGSGRQKRIGEDACRNDWVLDLDADEVVSDELAAEIRELFRDGEPTTKVYTLRVVTAPPVGEPWHNVHVVLRNRLYDRRVIRAPDHKAWDQLVVPPNMPVGKLSGALMHYSFRDLEHFTDKMNKMSSRRARDGHARSLAQLRLRVLFGLPAYFFKIYVLRGLWRAGVYGFAVARITAHARWLRDAKMYEAQRRSKESAAPASEKIAKLP